MGIDPRGSIGADKLSTPTLPLGRSRMDGRLRQRDGMASPVGREKQGCTGGLGATQFAKEKDNTDVLQYFAEARVRLC